MNEPAATFMQKKQMKKLFQWFQERTFFLAQQKKLTYFAISWLLIASWWSENKYECSEIKPINSFSTTQSDKIFTRKETLASGEGEGQELACSFRG